MPQKKMIEELPSEDSDSASPNKRQRTKFDKGSKEYTDRRERNNLAVKKSRERSRAKARETVEQVQRLRQENEMLEQKVQILSKELSVLKDLFLAHAGTVTETNFPVTTATTTMVPDHQYTAIKNDT